MSTVDTTTELPQNTPEASTQGDLIIDAVDVHKEYHLAGHRVSVLNGASLQVYDGERLAIIGRSGAGKSTLLHLLGLLDRPDKGDVTLDGVPASRMSGAMRTSRRARDIGFVFQSYHLLPEMDIVENVVLPAYAVPGSLTAARERARDLLDRVGLGDRLRHRPMELSGGEQQRVALARAFMNRPRILLADEPTGILDADTGSQVLEHLFGMSETSAHALVLVTHDERIASSCDRVLRLDDGVIVDVA